MTRKPTFLLGSHQEKQERTKGRAKEKNSVTNSTQPTVNLGNKCGTDSFAGVNAHNGPNPNRLFYLLYKIH